MKAVVPHTFADSCIIFMFFMSFMVKMAVLSGLVSLWLSIVQNEARGCPKWEKPAVAGVESEKRGQVES